MKGLMVTLLVVLGSGSSLAQQFGGNDFSADKIDRTANQNSSLRTNQTRLQPLTRSYDRTSMRVAQSSSTDDGGFSPTSVQTIGGTDYKDDSSANKTVPVATTDRNQNNGLYRRSNLPSSIRSNSTSDGLASTGLRSGNSQANNQLRAWPLRVSPEWERTLKVEGYIYAPIKPQEQNLIGEVVMFQDNSQFGNRSGTGSNVTSNQWDVYKNTAIIDVDDFSLQEIQKRTLTLRNLGAQNLTGVALRYVRDNGEKINVQRIGNIPGNSPAGQVSTRNEYNQNQSIVNRDTSRGNRINDRQFDSSGQRDVSFSGRDLRQGDRRNFDSLDRDTVNNGGWEVNDGQRIRQPRQTFQRDDSLVSQRNARDRFADDNRDISLSNNRRLSNDYLDGLQRRDLDDRDQRDADYVRNRINQNRDETDVRFDVRRDEETFSTSNRMSDDTRDSRYLSYDGRSSDYDTNFASQKRELQERLLDAKRLEERNAKEAAWLKRQRELVEEAKLARLYDDDLTPLRRPTSLSSNYSSGPYGFGAERLADRSTDPSYNGIRPRTVTRATSLDASVERVVQELNEREAAILTKVEVAKHLSKLNPIEKDLDDEIKRLKGERNGSTSGGKVHSLVSQTVPNTLGGDLAAPRRTQLASIGNSKRYDGLNGGPRPLDINGYGQRGQRNQTAAASFGDQTAANGNSDGRMLRLMWLLLLISLGANFYLAMLSRSFYTQYEELADELRETFSNSSSMSSPRTSSRPSSI